MPHEDPNRAGTPRIGIFGGTFDPPHIGHLIVAAEVRRQLALDLVLVVVANDPWQKTGVQAISAASDRMAMVQEAISGHNWLVASSIEIDRGGPSYMVDTLRELQQHQSATWFVILGADAYAGVSTWHEATALPDLCQFVVVGRPYAAADDRLADGCLVIEMPAIEVSSTVMRNRVAAGEPIDFLTPDAVVRVIRERNLYREPPA